MDARIELECDRRKPVLRFCSCRHDPTSLRYGPYRVPRPSACEIENQRFYCDDVDHLDPIKVEDELIALVRRLAVLSPERRPVDHEWLLFRRQRLLDHRRRLEGPPPDDHVVEDLSGDTVPATSEPGPKVRVVVVEVE